VDLSEVGELVIENLRNGARATRTVRSPDGNFFALLPMLPGPNPIQIGITSGTNGAPTQTTFDLVFSEERRRRSR
jgi:hypothetical protein